ncbi:hypothetical protein CPA50_01230 [Marinobacter sp. ANT_B65]|nr:hypothetical protein CPA50_01230 [Marinobacter sp. ANT_B65]
MPWQVPRRQNLPIKNKDNSKRGSGKRGVRLKKNENTSCIVIEYEIALITTTLYSGQEEKRIM